MRKNNKSALHVSVSKASTNPPISPPVSNGDMPTFNWPMGRKNIFPRKLNKTPNEYPSNGLYDVNDVSEYPPIISPKYGTRKDCDTTPIKTEKKKMALEAAKIRKSDEKALNGANVYRLL